MSYLYQYIVCMVVIFFVGLSLRAKPLISFLAGAAGAVGYVVYLLCPEPKIGYLLSALVLTLLSELLARICKLPANNFLVLGIYPLVPGIALFRTMAYAVQGDYTAALDCGGEALVCIILMTVAIALVPTTFRILFKEHRKHAQKRFKSTVD